MEGKLKVSKPKKEAEAEVKEAEVKEAEAERKESTPYLSRRARRSMWTSEEFIDDCQQANPKKKD